MWFAPLLRSFHSGSRRPRVGRLRSSKRATPPRVRLQLEMLEDRRVPSTGLSLFDPFGPSLLSDGFHASDFLDNSSANSGFVLPGNGGGSPTSSSGSSSAGTSENVGSSSVSAGSAGAQAPAISSPNSAVPNSQFLGAVASHSSSSPSGVNVSPLLSSSPAAGALLSVTSINSVTTDITSGNDQGHGIGIQSDGKIVVGGVANRPVTAGGNSSFAVVRYNPDLTLDTSYGNNGIETTQ